MSNPDTLLHVRGESRFADDEPLPAGALFAVAVPSPVAHGRLTAIETSDAVKEPGVCAILTGRDIPGQNQIGNLLPDEPLLAEDCVHCLGQPVALVLAESESAARRAAKAVRVVTDPLPAIFDPREARAAGDLLVPTRTFALGDVDRAWAECDLIVTGRADTGGQEHVYLETQAAIARPVEGGGVHLLSGTQAPTAVQRAVARVLALPMHQVEVEVRRLGGGFGGKEDQATLWAALAALGAWKTRLPVRLVLRRQEDMRWTGKRHPYSSDFKLGLMRDGRLVAYEVFFHQNTGCTADLSPAVLERTLFHATNSYFIPHVRATGACCRTNLPSNTAFRGFGGPQAMFVIESALHAAARALGVTTGELQRRNLLRAGDALPYGTTLQTPTLPQCWAEAEARFDVPARRREIAAFNGTHRWEKRGLALMPVCFGISFTTTFLNQAGALVHVFNDGSVAVSTAAVEMGQGTKAKLRSVAASALGICPERVRLDSTTTSRIANTSPTAASSGPDLNGHATQLACHAVLARLKEFAARQLGAAAEAIELREEQVCLAGCATDWDWLKLVSTAYLNRVNLSAHAHYATPEIHFDKATNQGHPFAYHAVGVAVVEATVDCLRGTGRVDAVRVVHDVGRSLDALVDRGQIEGGVLQGIGWMTMEECRYDASGRLLTDTLTTYKVPGLNDAPGEFEIDFLENSAGPAGIRGSKTVGEPPFMYGIGAYFALLEAMCAARPELNPFYAAPLTAERILTALEGAATPCTAQGAPAGNAPATP